MKTPSINDNIIAEMLKLSRLQAMYEPDHRLDGITDT